MKKKLKATLNQYFSYFKNLKLGVIKASFFFKDLDSELKTLSISSESEFFFYNPETNVKYYFEDSQESKIKIDSILDNLMLKYFIFHSDLIYIDEYNNSFAKLLYLVENSFVPDIPQNFNLNQIFSCENFDLIQKQLVLYKFIVLSFVHFKSTKISYNDFIDLVDYKIINFCFLRKYSEVQKIIFLERLVLQNQTFESRNKIFSEIFKVEFSNSEIQNNIIFCLISWHKKLNKKDKLNTELEKIYNFGSKPRPLVKTVIDTLFWFEDFFKLEDGLLITTLDFMNFQDEFLNLKMPSLSEISKRNSLVTIDNDKLILEFLEPLDSCRIFFKLNFLDKFFKLNLKHFESLCKRYRAFENLEKISAFACDFLGKKRMQKIILNERLIPHVFEVQDLVNLIYYKKILLQEKIFRNIVMGSFSKFYIKGEDAYFSKKDKWIKTMAV